ncbi:uncharacterized protein LOC131023568 [Salvia miltiorrhiza]|uniref:uncharacterized protein LOC131023568 n=1 Tax=Salvia miltiorrhiza TaxID=226208 RepID=UPI0025ACBC72|nr:uncharacterized protein LOC131023568 [Salvia miltiorrhiza]
MEKNFIHPAKIGKDDIRISHLQYVDDTIFLLEDKESNAVALRYMLNIFQLISGLAVNFSKSSLIGIEVEDTKIERMAAELRCKVGDCPFNYLGLKIGVGSNKVVNWSYLVDKVKKRVNGWTTRTLSLAGRITLVKSVLMVIPIYQLSFSCIPKQPLSLNSIFCKFLWGESANLGSIPWVKWNDLCTDFKDGGLGFKNLDWFNVALVSK